MDSKKDGSYTSQFGIGQNWDDSNGSDNKEKDFVTD